MELIDKDKVVTEIERRIGELFTLDKASYEVGLFDAYKIILSFINTLEVKEVDLEKELDEWLRYGPHTNYPWCTIPDAIKITAEHFYELGLKAKGE